MMDWMGIPAFSAAERMAIALSFSWIGPDSTPSKPTSFAS